MTKMKSIRLVQLERPFFFAILNGADDKQLQEKLLKRMTQRQVNALATVALNVLYGSIGVSQQKKESLRELKPFLRSLSDEDIGPSTRKKIILKHVGETFKLVKLIFTNIDLLIWRDTEARARKREE